MPKTNAKHTTPNFSPLPWLPSTSKSCYTLSPYPSAFYFLKTTSLTFNLKNLGNQDQKANIKTFGAAYISPGGLQVTSNERSANLQQQVGKATYIDRLHLWDNSTGKLADFSTHFVFVIDSEGRPNFADGLAFFLAPDGSKITAGGAIGLPIDPVTIVPTSPFVAVEFDTFQNGWDPVNVGRARHVGIDVNSLTSSVTAVWSCAHGRENEAWIRYNGYNSRVKGSIDFIVDLRNYLPEWVTIGFSASTGSYFEKNTVKSWEFSSSLEIDETEIIELQLKKK